MVEIQFTLYNRGLSNLADREILVDIEPQFVRDIRSVTVMNSDKTSIDVDFDKVVNSTKSYIFTLPRVEGRKQTTLALIFRGHKPLNYKKELS